MGKASSTTVKKAAVKKTSTKKTSVKKVRKVRIKKPVFDGPLVSIVMPAYNAAKFLDDTIHSVLGQTYKNWELIVVDDHSVDNTLEVLKQFKSDKIKVIACKKNGGAVNATNRGIRVAKGDILCFIDANDTWQPDKLSRQIAFMRENEAAFVFSSYVFANAKGDPKGKVMRMPAVIDSSKKNLIMTSTVMLDMKIISKTDAKMEQGKRKWMGAFEKVGQAYGMHKVMAIRGYDPGLSFFEKIRRGVR